MASQNLMLIIMTAKNCGGCIQLRGDGKILDNPRYPRWNVDYFTKIFNLKQKNDIIVYNIHFLDYSIRQSLDVISALSIISLNDKKIIRKIHVPSDIGYEIVIETNGIETSREKINESFYMFLANKISTEFLTNFCYAYPSFYFVNSKLWERSIKGEKILYAYINGFKTEKHPTGPGWINSHVSTIKTQKDADNINIITNILNGNINLDPNNEAENVGNNSNTKTQMKVIKSVNNEIAPQINELQEPNCNNGVIFYPLFTLKKFKKRK